MTQLGLDYSTKWGRGYTARFVRNLYHATFLVPYTHHLSTLEVRGVENLSGRSDGLSPVTRRERMTFPFRSKVLVLLLA